MLVFQNLLNSYCEDPRLFLKFYDQGVEKRRHSYAAYVSLVKQCALLLKQRLGSLEGQAVVVAMSNSDHQLVVYGALLYIGVAIVPANPIETDDYLRTLKTNSRASLIVSDVVRGLETLLFNDFDNLLGLPPIPDELVRPSDPEALAVMVSTSGTTHNPKLVCLTQKNLFANMKSLQEFHRLERDSVHFCVLPLFHVNAFGFSFLTVLFAGGTLILNSRFHKESFWRLIHHDRAQTANIVPEIAQRLIDAGVGRSYQVSPSLKYVVSAASALTTQQFVDFQKMFHIPLLQGYGLSEAVNFSLVTPHDLDSTQLDTLIAQEQRPPAGVAIPGNEVRVLSEGRKGFLRERQLGDIVIRGENVMKGYFENEPATADSFFGDWLLTGDRGYFVQLGDDRKIFFVTGRTKNVVKRNSESICLEEIEDQIKSFSGLTDIAVVGFPNRWTGEEIGLVVCSNAESQSSQSLELQMVKAFSFYKRPKVIQWVNEIPKTGSFKIKRRLLVDLFRSWSETRFADQGRA